MLYERNQKIALDRVVSNGRGPYTFRGVCGVCFTRPTKVLRSFFFFFSYYYFSVATKN